MIGGDCCNRVHAMIGGDCCQRRAGILPRHCALLGRRYCEHHGQLDLHDVLLPACADGVNWAVGELLPQGWTETTVAEMKNGSLLLTSRMYGDLVTQNKRREFARSDTGGETWQAVWYVMDRQPEIGLLQPTAAEALVSDPAVNDGKIYWSHPGIDTHGRANYTLDTSDNGGASWDFANRVYAGGAGYSDALILQDGDQRVLAMAFQKTFDCPTGEKPCGVHVPGIEGGGYTTSPWPTTLCNKAVPNSILLFHLKSRSNMSCFLLNVYRDLIGGARAIVMGKLLIETCTTTMTH